MEDDWSVSALDVQRQVIVAQAKIGQLYGGLDGTNKPIQKRTHGEMKIEIEHIVNGWLVTATTLQHGPNGRHFADTPEAICGMIAEWVLAECKRQEGTIK